MSGTFEMYIDLENDGWLDENGEIDGEVLAHAINAVAIEVVDGINGSIIDPNGNRSGSWAITEDPYK